MPRLRDFALATRRVGFFRFWKRVWEQCSEDGIFTWASALAYSWLFAVFPFLVFLLTLVPYLPVQGKDWLEENAEPVLNKALPTDAYRTIWEGYLRDRLPKLLKSRPAGFLGTGLLLTIFAASGGMAVTIKALDKCYDVEEGRSFIFVRLLAIFLTVVVASLMLVVMVLLPVATAVLGWVQRYLVHLNPPIEIPKQALLLFEVGRFALAMLCMFLALGILYHFGPSIKHRFRVFTPGAVFCVIVWLVLGALFRLYVDKFGKYEQTYGPVGGVVVLLLLFYLDSAVLLIGAEINSEIDFISLGVKPGEKDFRGKPWEHEKLSAVSDGASSG